MKKNKKLTFEIGDNVELTINITGFMSALDLRCRVLDAETIAIHPKKGVPIYSLTQCAQVVGVASSQLNYYVKDKTVKPVNKTQAGFKKYFDYEALLTFWIIIKLKEQMRINISVVKSLQKRLDAK